MVRTTTTVNLRRSPGFTNKPADDVLISLTPETLVIIAADPRSADGVSWWQVQTTTPAGATVTGWIAESMPGTVPLIEKVAETTASPAPLQASFAVGELVTTADTVRVQRTPGINNKLDDDVLGFFESRTTLNILEGPHSADGLTSWRVGGITLATGAVIGWVAEKAPNNGILLARAPKLPGTNIVDGTAGIYLGAPFAGTLAIAQLWGENPHIYNNATYDSVPLKGHNGIDFLTPIGTPVLAVENATVTDAVLNDPTGFGNYIKLRHSWGESIYAHMDSLGVQPGQSVQRGTLLGRSGSTGFVAGPHLHFAIRINPYDRKDGWGGFSDPLPYLNPRSFQLPAYVLDVAATALPDDTPTRSLEEVPDYAPDRPDLRQP